MFSKPIVSLGALVLATVTAAKPLPAITGLLSKRHGSFNGYGGYGSMSNFDDFYGSSDFSGVSQTFAKQKEVVCHSEQVEIVQQRLAVIREWYKKIITEQICEVEVQTIVHSQFVSGCEGFSGDLRHKSSRDISYDYGVAAQISDIHDSNNECVANNLDWHGYEVGSHAISYSGDNWNAQYSPPSVDHVYNSCQQSYGYSSPSYSSSWQSGYNAPSYTYEAPSYGSTYEAPSYGSTYEAPSYDSTYEAPPTYTDSSYGGYSYEAPPPTYTTDASYGGSYGGSYGSSGSYNSYAAPPAEYSAPSYGSGYGGSSDVTGCSTCGGMSSDASAPAATDMSGGSDSVPAPTDAASASAATDAAATDAAATDTAATDAAATDAAAATGSAAASSAPSAAASASA